MYSTDASYGETVSDRFDSGTYTQIKANYRTTPSDKIFQLLRGNQLENEYQRYTSIRTTHTVPFLYNTYSIV